MLFISKQGHVDAERIQVKIFSEIERSPMSKVNGIVVHQTDSPTAESTFNSYRKKGANGAHFLIDKDGTIYQTASLLKRTNHVGKLKSRCIITHECPTAELKIATGIENKYTKLSIHEHKKYGRIATHRTTTRLALNWLERHTTKTYPAPTGRRKSMKASQKSKIHPCNG
ncbi:peptidoglycan recognition protein family protein [Burkholderia ubonensis]|uniref:peptidoglycan recognition protein family protein n=1 Tax=Burkholderia ubonensis TaxID=101571 RepID=UPI000B272C70|nr:N-acetylmuramoyl-L-alanine amidase [Burkholderia ubonensis]